MKFVGIDYGSRRIGIAVSDPDGRIAFPRHTYENDSRVLAHLADLVAAEGIERIIVGDTKSYSGRDNPVTSEAHDFMERLGAATGVPVVPVYEAGTSVEASRYAPEHELHNDAAAAAIILQRFLDMNAGNSKF